MKHEPVIRSARKFPQKGTFLRIREGQAPMERQPAIPRRLNAIPETMNHLGMLLIRFSWSA
ncbi:Hypothetical protein FKW44_015328 [Caligus rogercresseyi]|uniref:Uncharacterized protein n=1 Tax=Caligus rogercresseyi TaxID=217165 RepID=A0A7T8H0U8_CALRO|nr:Hypothetical protein FKW44_015328 [Caligus rogercresseyi]